MKNHAKTVNVFTLERQVEHLRKRLSEHKNGVKKHDTKNGIAVHSWTSQHQVNWEAAKTREVEGNYWRRRLLEAVHIHREQHTSNLDWPGH